MWTLKKCCISNSVCNEVLFLFIVISFNFNCILCFRNYSGIIPGHNQAYDNHKNNNMEVLLITH